MGLQYCLQNCACVYHGACVENMIVLNSSSFLAKVIILLQSTPLGSIIPEAVGPMSQNAKRDTRTPSHPKVSTTFTAITLLYC